MTCSPSPSSAPSMPTTAELPYAEAVVPLPLPLPQPATATTAQGETTTGSLIDDDANTASVYSNNNTLTALFLPGAEGVPLGEGINTAVATAAAINPTSGDDQNAGHDRNIFNRAFSSDSGGEVDSLGTPALGEEPVGLGVAIELEELFDDRADGNDNGTALDRARREAWVGGGSAEKGQHREMSAAVDHSVKTSNLFEKSEKRSELATTEGTLAGIAGTETGSLSACDRASNTLRRAAEDGMAEDEGKPTQFLSVPTMGARDVEECLGIKVKNKQLSRVEEGHNVSLLW